MSCPLTIDLSQYKNIFGKPGTGLHQYKFKGTALFDYFLTIAGAFIVTYYTDIPLVITTIGLLLLGILFHSLFGISSQALKYLGY
tara:strand:- start:37 stop:291 length:255 start_codon:yes stop_codon:yes gene_type:complete